jgi:FtsP/CotA-like multicopper oxidase with cupredoxin domain
MRPVLDRRTLLAAGLAASSVAAPRFASAAAPLAPAPGRLRGEATSYAEEIRLRLAPGRVQVEGRTREAVLINQMLPGPLLRLKEGSRARLVVENGLSEQTSLHWHGLIVPFQMDGVPGVSFPGIDPGGRYDYAFDVAQAGTYWYHSHSGLQELMGAYGAIVIDPAGEDPVAWDREHVLVLSDHGRVHPAEILRNLKRDASYYNRRKETLAGLLSGKDQPLKDRIAWARMRMDPTDIADVTGEVLDYLVNGQGPSTPWRGLFSPGERVRLRVVNAAGMTFFNLRLPGVPFTVVQADGQNVRAVETDELQIAPGETYDLIVTPPDSRAVAVVAESMDRSGMARAVLSPSADTPMPGFPPLRERPVLSMRDMGMEMEGMDMSGMSMRDGRHAPEVAMGPGVEMISPMPMDRTGEPGLGLGDAGHRVLVYRDLQPLAPPPAGAEPARTIRVHLTGAMDRYMWSMDGKTMSEAHHPLMLRTGERTRLVLVNDTMMAHPIHLHGHFFDLVFPGDQPGPRKHTVSVLPGGRVTLDVTPLPGDWAFHCHLFLHMAMGMMRIVQVRPVERAAG